VPNHPRLLAVATAEPPYRYGQDELLGFACDRVLGPGWPSRPKDVLRARQMERLFAASQVDRRQSAVELREFYAETRTTGERMAYYQQAAYALGRAALEACLGGEGGRPAAEVTDLISVSCTGYGAPGLDISLARDLGMRPDIRRVAIGHMGCFGAIVGLRQCLATVRAHSDATAAMLCVELSSLHFTPTFDGDKLTAFSLFGDAGAAVLMSCDAEARAPELVDTYCAADFSSADQMTWTITDQGFVMGLSPRVPITLRRNVGGVVGRLLDRQGLRIRDVAHWIVHPGGPSILQVIQDRLELSDEQMGPSWQVLQDHGNCSSATVLLILDELLRSGRTRAGEWGVVMAFGPGLTLETCLLRF
jgi:alkylresorcinol/alkylpyrone synthase